jgi:hypothetical protein
MSILKLTKPSDQLTSDDVRNMRRGRKPDGHNGNDWRYQGGRGKCSLMKVRPKYTWADEEAAAEEQEDKDGAFLRMNAFGETPKRAERMMNKGDSFDRDNFFKIFSMDLASLSPCSDTKVLTDHY